MDDIPTRKRLLRAEIEARIEALTSEERARQSAQVSGILEAWARTDFDVVLTTLPLAGEPDLSALVLRWLTRGRVALARTGPGRTMTFHYVPGLEGPWDTRAWGLREPPAGLPPWEPGPRTLCLVPGLGFAAAEGGGAWRLGRGAGYYDRWLETVGDRVVTLGVGFTVQTVAEVPVEAHDRRLDGWVDADGVHGAGQRLRIPSQKTE